MKWDKKYILCIDDDENVLESLRAELNAEFGEDFRLEWAVGGADAFEVVDSLAKRGIEPVVIVCDYIMPEMRGDEVLTELHQRFPQSKKILLTGQATIEGLSRAVNLASLYRFVSKPWQRDDLVLTLREALVSWEKDRILEAQNAELVVLNEHLEARVKERTVSLEEKNNELRLRVRELSALNRISNKLAITRNPQSSVEVVCEDLSLVLGCSQAMIGLVNLERTGLQLSAVRGEVNTWHGENSARGGQIAFSAQPLFSQVIDFKQAVFFSSHDAGDNNAEYAQYLQNRLVDSVLIVPLISWSEVTGLVVLERVKGSLPFTKYDTALVETAAGQLAGSLETLRLFDEERSARQEADRANKAKSQFLANMSHEIRTPMNAILGFTQILQQSEGLGEDHKEYIEIIRSSGHHLLNLISDVLDMSKIEAGKLTISHMSFDFYQLLDSVRGLFQLQALKRGLELKFEIAPDVPRFITTDEAKLNQVLINLINNALKFTHSGGVSIRVKTNMQPQHLSIEIEDTGMGIPEPALSEIFEAFYQVASTSDSQTEGTGLGLAISKKIIEALGGHIQVSSVLGKGSIFRFDIWTELVVDDSLKVPEETRPVVSLKSGEPSYRVLVVDDNRNNRLLLREMFTRLGLPVREAANGMEALEIADEWMPDLILLDLRMPVMDGYECARLLRTRAWSKALFIIAVTANAMEGDQSLCKPAGCDAFVTKPFREAELYGIVRDLLGLRFEFTS